MKCVVELTAAEDQTLQQLAVNHKHRDPRTRTAGALLLGRRVKLTEIASKLGVSGQSVYNTGARVVGFSRPANEESSVKV